MAARAISTATISFGLVSIPVKLFSTSQSGSGISFNMLHDKCNSRLKQQYICSKDGEIVGRDATVKGYEFSKDQYVVVTDEELKALEETASKSIEIREFVPAEQVDPLFFDGAYYLGPDKGGDRAFRLLGEALKRSEQCAIAKHAARGKQYLVLLRPFENGLIMQQLRWADEVKPLSELDLPATDVKDAELKLAMQFIEQLQSDEFNPDKYQDDVKLRMKDVIQKKIEGQAITLTPTAERQGQIIDLMEALKASLNQGGAAKKSGDERKPPKRTEQVEAPAAKSKKAKSK
ncbi:MAG: non-homologous end joining protein Ku [Myxococcaceae bacterium]